MPVFFARRETNSGYEIEICPRHQILRHETFYEMDPWWLTVNEQSGINERLYFDVVWFKCILQVKEE